MRIAIYGAGGVGGYFGGRLAEAGADVHLIARGDHLNAIQNKGLNVESIHGDFDIDIHATDEPAEIGECDYVLICVKSYDTAQVAQQLDPLIGENTAVISLQNGVDNEETLATEIGRDHVMGGVVYIFSTISKPGKIEHIDGPARIIFGELDGKRSERAERFKQMCNRSDGVESILSVNIWSELWEKFMFICAQAGATAAIRLPIGEIRSTDESWALYCDLLEEVSDVAKADGIQLSDSTLNEWISFAQDLDDGTYSSLHYDMTNGKRMELEAFHGTVVRKADEHDVDVPRSRSVYAILRPWAVRNEDA
jgi:2-dehydropantoate 2-reductase